MSNALPVHDPVGFYLAGSTTIFASRYDQRFSYCLYVPTAHTPDGPPVPLVVLQHGTGRRGPQYRDNFADWAEEQGCLVLAPLFPAGIGDPDDLHNFKFIRYGEIRFDQVLLAMVDEVGIVNNHSPVDLTTLTPIAGLSRGPSAIVVPKKSPYADLPALLAALKQNPRGVKWTGGSLGGPGHLTVAGLAKGQGVAVKDVNYVPTAGGGESMNLLLSGAATVGIDTVVELKPQIQAGALRVLAVDGSERVEGVDAPTLKELGLADKAVTTLAGVMAPAGLSAEQQKDVIAMVDKMRQSTCWQQVLKQNNWVDAWTPGDDFKKVLTDQRTQITAILTEMGLAK